MKRLLFSLFGVMLVLPLTTQISFAQQKPVCQYADSDEDGDGFGWENRDTCIVTEQSVQNAPTACIDDDGDGWGWNGRDVCRVDVAECQDSDPIGDGWGWNGVTSCVVPAYPAAFSELAVLRTNNRTLFGESIAAATLICAWQGDFQVYDLYENGRVNHTGSSHPEVGIWSTGFSDSDGILHIYLLGDGYTVRERILMQPGVATLQGNTPFFASDDCFWAS